MLCVHLFDEPAGFEALAGSWLARRPAEHSLILGVVSQIGTGRYPGPNTLVAVTDRSDIVGCAFRTPPHNVQLTPMPDEAARVLAAPFATRYGTIPAVSGPTGAARAFADAWLELSSATTCSEGLRLRLHQATAVRPSARAPGRLRSATTGDLDWWTAALIGFHRDAGLSPPSVTDARVHAERLIRDERAVLWDVGGDPRAIAAIVARSPGSERVSAVYTPAEWRGRGYASALVAALTERVLARTDAAVLYTDLANPTSNAIYARIGYEPVFDAVDLHFG